MKIMLRKEADKYIYGAGVLLALPILTIFAYQVEPSDAMAYFAAGTAIFAALVMGRPAFPIDMPTGPGSEAALANLADQQKCYKIGATLLVLAGLGLLPTLIKNLVTFRYSLIVMETLAAGWAITAGVRGYLQDGKFPFLRPIVWGMVLLLAILVNSLLISWPAPLPL